MTSSANELGIAYLLGTRPEVIRSARLLQLIASDPTCRLTLINSGQHYDENMLGAFLRELRVPSVGFDLEVGSDEPAEQTALVMSRVSEVLRRESPDCLCVFGDTNSSLGGALAAAKMGIPLAHIEAGCRSFDMSMPEEVNRRLIDHASALLLAVSAMCRSNLVSEDVLGSIEVVGDPQFDVFLSQSVTHQGGTLKDGPVGLLTLHRPDNVDDPSRLGLILGKLATAAEVSDIRWVFPVHPRTRHSLPDRMPTSVEVVSPMSYSGLLEALAQANVCVTDSGGLQKEALWMRVPCVTVRTTTEWRETVVQGANVLAPAEADIVGAVRNALDEGVYRDFRNPYGDGRASERILGELKSWLIQGAKFRVRPLSRSPQHGN